MASATFTVMNTSSNKITLGKQIFQPGVAYPFYSVFQIGCTLAEYDRALDNGIIKETKVSSGVTVSAGDVAFLATVAFTGVYADLTAKPTLGTAAAMSVGTGAGTVAAGNDSRFILLGTTGTTAAAGNDSRIVAATPNTRAVATGVGLSGGGNLTADRTIVLAAATTSVIGGLKVCAAQIDTVATDVAGLVTFVNGFLAKMRTAGILAP